MRRALLLVLATGIFSGHGAAARAQGPPVRAQDWRWYISGSIGLARGRMIRGRRFTPRSNPRGLGSPLSAARLPVLSPGVGNRRRLAPQPVAGRPATACTGASSCGASPRRRRSASTPAQQRHRSQGEAVGPCRRPAGPVDLARALGGSRADAERGRVDEATAGVSRGTSGVRAGAAVSIGAAVVQRGGLFVEVLLERRLAEPIDVPVLVVPGAADVPGDAGGGVAYPVGCWDRASPVAGPRHRVFRLDLARPMAAPPTFPSCDQPRSTTPRRAAGRGQEPPARRGIPGNRGGGPGGAQAAVRARRPAWSRSASRRAGRRPGGARPVRPA